MPLQKDTKNKELEAANWKQLRAGLRLRDIVTSKRMNDIGIDLQNLDQRKLII